MGTATIIKRLSAFFSSRVAAIKDVYVLPPPVAMDKIPFSHLLNFFQSCDIRLNTASGLNKKVGHVKDFFYWAILS